MSTTKYSNCCGAEPRSWGDNDTEDFGICPDCHDHCQYDEYCDGCNELLQDCTCPKPEDNNLLKNKS